MNCAGARVVQAEIQVSPWNCVSLALPVAPLTVCKGQRERLESCL